MREGARSSPAPDELRQPFTLAGAITAWNAGTRELTILGYALRLAPIVSTSGLDPGRSIVVAGFRESSTGEMVVTRVLVT
jgi:hypothetical protein